MMKGLLAVFSAILAIDIAFSLPTKSYVKPNTPENIERLKNLKPGELPYIYSGQFHGDMVLSPEQIEYYYGKGSKTVMTNDKFRWPNNIIPYLVDESRYTAAERSIIHRAVRRIMDVSCIKLVQYDPAVHIDYIFITKRDGCWSTVGKAIEGGEQLLSLGDGCIWHPIPIHEFLHSVGFDHMQTAPERDDYIRIVWENLAPENKWIYEKVVSDNFSQFGVPYDYLSVMHYGEDGFSKNGEPVMIALREIPGGKKMGQQDDLSEYDIARINKAFCSK